MFTQDKNRPEKKIRFQHQNFQRKLEQARTYKRPMRKIPQTQGEIFLNALGLGSFWSKLLVGGTICAAVYLVYVPNFLFVKSIQIVGLNPQDTATVQEATKGYLDTKTFWPRKNLLLLSTPKLKNYLIATQTLVLKINSIQKKYPSSLIITAEPRVSAFYVTTPQKTFVVSGDGLITSEVAPNILEASSSTSTLNSNLLPVNVQKASNLNVGDRAFDPNLLSCLQLTTQNLQGITNAAVQSIELIAVDQPDLTVNTTGGYKLILDTASDIHQTLGELKVLINQLAPGDKNRLYYIDMRIKNKAYVCYKGTACVKTTNINPGTTSSTPEAITN